MSRRKKKTEARLTLARADGVLMTRGAIRVETLEPSEVGVFEVPGEVEVPAGERLVLIVEAFGGPVRVSRIGLAVEEV